MTNEPAEGVTPTLKLLAASEAESRLGTGAETDVGSPVIQPRAACIPESPIFVVSTPRGSR